MHKFRQAGVTHRRAAFCLVSSLISCGMLMLHTWTWCTIPYYRQRRPAGRTCNLHDSPVAYVTKSGSGQRQLTLSPPGLIQHSPADTSA